MNVGRPLKLDMALSKGSLKTAEMPLIRTHFPRRHVIGNGKGCQCTCCLANAPFRRVFAITTVGDMSGANVLAGWQQVVYSHRQQCTKWNLKGQRTHINKVCPGR